ncbi:MAG: sigma-54-dependent transcriptional regulator [Bacteriovoracia bacterium]
MGKVLVVDDEKNITLVIEAMLARAGFTPVVFNDSARALRALKQERPHAVITDLYMPGPTGMEILEYCKEHLPDLPVVIITAFGTVEAAVAALKKGAFDFITKPFDQTELLNVARKAVETFRLREEDNVQVSSIVSHNPQMKEVLNVIHKVARSPSTILILGESGTGKELVAYEIHKQSDRADKPFVKINCGAIPATLIESELFGYEKGAFTGAVTAKPGRFELANTGTIFLDEVAEMPLEMQVKLLRVLQEHQFERVGGIHSTTVDVRIITATNRNLEQEVKEGRFREDLFYRLNVVPIQLPPLRERRDDIEQLVRTFMDQFNVKLERKVTNLPDEVLGVFKTYAWPGNIRQLQNTIERMILMADGSSLRLADLPEEIAKFAATGGTPPPAEGESSFKEIVRRQTQSVERELIEKSLAENDGNVTRTAEALGLSRKGLQLKLKELGIKRSEE